MGIPFNLGQFGKTLAKFRELNLNVERFPLNGNE